MKRSTSLVSRIGFLGIVILINACSEPPRHQLSVEERKQDLAWLFSKIKNNYAPLDMKSQKYGINFEKLQQRYFERAETVANNDEFSLLLHEAAAELKDAHTSLRPPTSSLRNKIRTAYLGFDGKRKGDNLLVKKLLPSIAAESGFPVKVDDEITQLDGVPLKEVVKRDFVKYRDLGNEETNYTIHYPKVFNRLSNSHPFPKTNDARITIKRKEKEFTVTVPWIVKDLFDFTAEQAAAEKVKVTNSPSHSPQEASLNLWELGQKALLRQLPLSPSLVASFTGNTFWNHFLFVDTAPTWGSPALAKILMDAAGKPTSPIDMFKKERNVPPGAIFVGSGKPYPAYVFSEKLPKKDKEPQRVRTIGYLYLNTFDPYVEVPETASSAAALQEKKEQIVLQSLSESLMAFKTLGVKHIIVDLLDNEGGLMTLGMRVAQKLYASKLTYPEIQFRANDAWLDTFESTSIGGLSDAEREVARRVYQSLEEDRRQGLLVSRKHTVESLLPFRLVPNELLEEDFDVTLLVNEGCASMCDVFTALLKENKVATVVGSRTMGAGGSVQVEGELPNSHFILQQTRSLLVRRDGSYLENNGVEPDEKVEVSATEAEKYDGVRKKAVELILQKL